MQTIGIVLTAILLGLFGPAPAQQGKTFSIDISFLPAPEDIERCNNLLRVLSPKQGYNWGFGAISRPDSLTGFMLHRRSAFVPRRSSRS